MVQYFLAGRVNSEEYAICERLLDIMCVALPDATVSKYAHKPDKWNGTAAELMRIYGFRLPVAGQVPICDLIVWTDTGRLLCTDAEAFSTYAMKNFGIQLDLSETELMLYIKANIEEMRHMEEDAPQQSEVA